MNNSFYFIFIVFCVTTVLVVTVYFRNAKNQYFYRLCLIKAEQSRLGEQVWQNQLRLEGLLNPAALSERIEE